MQMDINELKNSSDKSMIEKTFGNRDHHK